jgi:Spy/CpxP family protein refolding chaperone
MQNASPEERRAHFQQTRQQVDAKIEAILTDAQKKKFAEMRANMKQHRMHGEGESQQPRPPDRQQ